MIKEITTWNIYELMIWLDKCVEHIYTQIFIEIRNVINKVISTRRYWYKWVDKVQDENCEHAINLNFSSDVNQNVFIMWDCRFKSETWKVTYNDDRPPECDCGIFVSSKVSPHICFILKLFLNEQ